MEPDHFDPIFALGKELNLQFVLDYTPNEFNTTLHNIADGRIPVEPHITEKVGYSCVAQAFEDLASLETHAMIIVEPRY